MSAASLLAALIATDELGPCDDEQKPPLSAAEIRHAARLDMDVASARAVGMVHSLLDAGLIPQCVESDARAIVALWDGAVAKHKAAV